jgi:transposase
LGADHFCFFVRGVVERLDLTAFEQAYSEEGGMLYAPEMMLGLWLYAYGVGITSARQLARRAVEDLALRYLAGGTRPDNWALSAFRRRHGRALNDCFTQVLEMARSLGMGRLGRVAIDSTRIRANASADRSDSEQALRDTRAQLRRQVRQWQRAADRDDSEPGGMEVAITDLKEKLAGLAPRLEKLQKSGLRRLSRTDPEARFLRQRGGFALGYTAEIAVSDDHLIVAQQVTQNSNDTGSLLPVVAQVRERCGEAPAQVLADSGFFSLANLEQLEEQSIEGFVPDSNLASALNRGHRCRTRAVAPVHRRMRARLRSPAGQAIYARRKAIVEPVFGTLKQQRSMRQFRTRGLQSVGCEFTLSTLAYNLGRIHTMQRG